MHGVDFRQENWIHAFIIIIIDSLIGISWGIRYRSDAQTIVCRRSWRWAQWKIVQFCGTNSGGHKHLSSMIHVDSVLRFVWLRKISKGFRYKYSLFPLDQSENFRFEMENEFNWPKLGRNNVVILLNVLSLTLTQINSSNRICSFTSFHSFFCALSLTLHHILLAELSFAIVRVLNCNYIPFRIACLKRIYQFK